MVFCQSNSPVLLSKQFSLLLAFDEVCSPATKILSSKAIGEWVYMFFDQSEESIDWSMVIPSQGAWGASIFLHEAEKSTVSNNQKIRYLKMVINLMGDSPGVGFFSKIVNDLPKYAYLPVPASFSWQIFTFQATWFCHSVRFLCMAQRLIITHCLLKVN